MSLRTDAERAAQLVIDLTWEPGKFPVDPVKIANQYGVNVRQGRLPDDVSGALIKKRNDDAIIFVETTDNERRKRFTVAHELGHYISRLLSIGNASTPETDSESEYEYEFIDFRNPKSATGDHPDEVLANSFAAELLMPASDVKKMHKDSNDPLKLALVFGVSGDAMKFRLINLGLITDKAA